MLNRIKIPGFIYCLVVIAFSVLLLNCRSSAPQTEKKADPPLAAQIAAPSPKVEKPLAVTSTSQPQPSPDPPKESTKTMPRPTRDEVTEALARTYQDSVVIDSNESNNFVVGDFNGDGSQDIAIVVKPAEGKLSDLNSEVANWTIQSPRKAGVPEKFSAVRRLSRPSAPERVSSTETLLVIIHGNGEKGWRDSSAKQTYLLRSAVGDQMRQRSMKDVLKTASDKSSLPKQTGDVITETIGKESGFIFWNGSQYVWYHHE